MSVKSLPKPPKIVLEDKVDVQEEAPETPLSLPERQIQVSLQEPPSVLLWFGLLGYIITFMGTFTVWDNDISLCLNILCCGSFTSTVCLLIHYNNYGYWNKSNGQSSANEDIAAIMLGVIAAVILVLYFFISGF